MTSFLLHDPPRLGVESHKDSAGPPATAIFFNFPLAKNAMNRLSGDQNGELISLSVPGSSREASESRSRTSGAAQDELLDKTAPLKRAEDWSRDGRYLIEGTRVL